MLANDFFREDKLMHFYNRFADEIGAAAPAPIVEVVPYHQDALWANGHMYEEEAPGIVAFYQRTDDPSETIWHILPVGQIAEIRPHATTPEHLKWLERQIRRRPFGFRFPHGGAPGEGQPA